MTKRKVTKTNTKGLAGKLLLAMPSMGDPRFHRAVIMVCAHDDDGAMGLIINHTVPGIDLRHLLGQLNIDSVARDDAKIPDLPVMSGGPVENARGFILHSLDFHEDDTVTIGDNLGVTGTVDALKAIAEGRGPEDLVFVLGYAGWESGQLDRELQDNAWLVLDSDHDLIFEVPAEEKWDVAVQKLGVDPAKLSGIAGRA